MTSSYVGPTYEQLDVVRRLHSVPRFDRTSDIAVLTSSDPDAPMEYTIGALFITLLLFSVFVVWAATLFVVQCMGPGMVGFWSGDGFREPKHSDGRPFVRPRRVRIVFLCCAALIVTFSVLLILFGLNTVETTTISLENSTADVRDAVDEGSAIASSLTAIGASTETIRDDLMIDLSVFCPNGDVSDFIGSSIDSEQIGGALDDLNDFIMDDLRTMKNNLEQVRRATDVVNNALQTYTQWRYRPVYWIPLIAFCSVFIVGTVLAWKQASPYAFRCIQAYVLLPLFTVWIIFSWLMAGAVGAVAVMNSDICSGGDYPGSPGGTIKSILEVNEVDPNGLFYQAAEYYVDGCRSDDPFSFIEGYRDQLQNAHTVSKSFVVGVELFGTDELSLLCGNNVTSTVQALKVLYSNMVILLENANRTIDLLSCERINPIYVRTFHEAGCESAVTGLAWILAALIVISVCGLIMVTLRSALLHVKYRDPTDYPERPAHEHAPKDVAVDVPSEVGGDDINHTPMVAVPIHTETQTHSGSKSWEEISPSVAQDIVYYDTVVPVLQCSSSVEQHEMRTYASECNNGQHVSPQDVPAIDKMEIGNHEKVQDIRDQQAEGVEVAEKNSPHGADQHEKQDAPPPMDIESFSKSWEAYPTAVAPESSYWGDNVTPSVENDAAVVWNDQQQSSEV